MKDGGTDVARGLDQGLLVVIVQLRPRQIFVGMEIFQRRLRHDPARQSDRIRGDAAVLVGGEIIRLDARRVGRIGRAQPQRAAAGRAHVAYARREGGEGVQRLAEAIE